MDASPTTPPAQPLMCPCGRGPADLSTMRVCRQCGARLCRRCALEDRDPAERHGCKPPQITHPPPVIWR